MERSKKFRKLLFLIISLGTAVGGYAGFTEINSSGEIVSLDHKLTTSFETPYKVIQTPEKTSNLWDKISETVKYHQVKPQPAQAVKVAIVQPEKSVLNPYLEQNKKLLAANKNLDAENKDLREKINVLQKNSTEVEKKLVEMESQINFLATQLRQVEADVFVMTSKNSQNLSARK